MIAFTPNPNLDQDSSAGQSYGGCLTSYARGRFTNMSSGFGTLSGSIAGNQLTVTAGSVTVGNFLWGPGIPGFLKIASGTGPYTLATAGGLGTVNLTLASETMATGTPLVTANKLGLT